MAATVAMDMTTLRIPVDLAARAAMAVPSATEEMAEMEEVGLPPEMARLLPVGLVEPAGTGVAPAALAATADQEARHPPRERIQLPSEEMEATAVRRACRATGAMAEREVPRMSLARMLRLLAVLVVLVETGQWVETAEPAAMRTP